MEAARIAPARKPDGFFRALWKAARAVFHETTGTLFFLLALSWLSATVRLWRRGSTSWELVICAGFVTALVAFGITSFRAARRVR